MAGRLPLRFPFVRKRSLTLLCVYGGPSFFPNGFGHVRQFLGFFPNQRAYPPPVSLVISQVTPPDAPLRCCC